MKCSVKLFFIVISLAAIAAYPQNNNNGCMDTESSDLNKNPVKCSNTVPTNDTEPDKTKDETVSHLTHISAGQEPDLTVLNIPYKNKEKSLEILTKATKSSKNNENYTQNVEDNKVELNNKENNGNKQSDKLKNKTVELNQKIPEVSITQANKSNTKINEADSNIANILYNNNDKTFAILSSLANSLKTNENTKQNKTETSMEVREDVIENKQENLLNKTLNLNNITAISSSTSKPSDDNLSSSDILLSEITNLSQDDIEEGSVMGQNIQIQRSAINSDIDENSNSAGVDILRNVSIYCGRLFGKRISFANETTLMEFPWTALLLYNTHTRYHCGGSLITEKYVLTAAHCVAQDFYELSGVRLGEYDVTENPDCAPDLVGENICATTIDVDVVKIIIHHGYSQLSFRNDIALLRLDKNYISRSYYPICLPTPDKTYTEDKAIVAGWGATHKAIRSAKLLKAEVPIIEMSKCREIYRHSKFNDTTEICGSGVNEVDVCKGDSGGALFFNDHVNGKDTYIQLGIVSLGVRRCGDERFLPAVFTKVKGFYKWIENNLEY